MGLMKLGFFLGNTACVALATAALATTQKAAAEEESYKSATLEEIVVTSRKREESLQQVPISVTAITATDMEARSFSSLKDIGQYTPGLSIDNQGQAGKSASLIYIRGIGQTDVTITNDPGVGVYIDGVYLGRMQGLDLEMMDLERIEVLRGPQGTLFGKNTIGGAINVVSAKPNFDWGAKLKVVTGQYDRIDGLANLNVPVVQDKLAIKLSGSTRNQDGYGHSLFDGQKMGNTNSLSGRGTALFMPAEHLEVLVSVDGTRVREQASPFKMTTAQSPLVQLVNLVASPLYDDRWHTDGYYTNYSTGANRNDSDHWGTSLSIDWDTGPVNIKSITSYRENESTYGTDFDGSPIDLVEQTIFVDQDQFSQEFQVGGSSFNDRLAWVAGLYYFTESAHQTYTDYIAVPLQALGVDLSFIYDLTIKNKSYAAYGQGTYSLTDELSITAGLRYTYEKKNGEVFHYSPISGATLLPLTTNSDDWTAFSPRVSLEYQWNPDLMTYVSAAQGFKSGGFNGLTSTSEAFTSYDPEKVWTYEAGFRSDLLSKRLRFNATAYLSKYNDIQFTVIKGDSEGRPSVEVGNAGKAEIKGIELELVAVPVAGLTINGGLGYIDAKYTEADPGAQVTVNSKFVRTPKWTATLSGEYVMPVLDRFELITRLDYAYKSKIYHDVANSPVGIQKGYGLLNGRMTLASQDQVWAVSAFVTNLTNKKYLLSALDFMDSLGLATYEYAAPRRWGASFEYNF